MSYRVPYWEYIKSRCWTCLMTSSSVTTLDMATSQEIFGNKDLVNQSANKALGIEALTNLLCHLHTWIWSEMWVAIFGHNKVRSSVPVSYRMGNWKCVRNAIAKDWKMKKEETCNSMNYLAALSVRVLGNSHNLMESSKKELETHHRWYMEIWFAGSSHQTLGCQ